jgi:hypothetical protein
LVEGRIDGKAVETLLAKHPLEAGEPFYAVDGSRVGPLRREIRAPNEPFL